MKKVLLITFALITGVAVITCLIYGKSLPFMSMPDGEMMESGVDNEMSDEDLKKRLDIFLASNKFETVGQNSHIISKCYVLPSLDYNACIEGKFEPLLHDGLTMDDVRALIGKPAYETEDVWVYPDDGWLFLFKDGKLYKLVQTDKYDEMGKGNVDRLHVMKIYDPLNIDAVRKGIQKSIQEEKEFRERRDAILNSDEELARVCTMSSEEFRSLLGEYDIPPKTNILPKYTYETEERYVYFVYSEEGKVIQCARNDKETQEFKIIYTDMEYPLFKKLNEKVTQLLEDMNVDMDGLQQGN